MSTIITAQELTELLRKPDGCALLDVRLAEDFAGQRLPGAVNQCVFEVVFLTELERRGIRKDQPVCVYGAAEDSQESCMAAEKLERVGYTQVFDFRGGVEAWKAAGLPIEEHSAAAMRWTSPRAGSCGWGGTCSTSTGAMSHSAAGTSSSPTVFP